MRPVFAKVHPGGDAAASTGRGSQLRRRLVIAFLSVSVGPVLAASFVAAQWITSQFDTRLELWLEDAARFFAQSLQADQTEASRAAAILAASLTDKADELKTQPLTLYANLLASVGYEFVVIYGDDGSVLYRFGDVDSTAALPRKETASFFQMPTAGRPALVVGASRRFMSNGRAYYAFVADRASEDALEIVGADTSLRFQVMTVVNGQALPYGSDKSPPPGRAHLEKAVSVLSGTRETMSERDARNSDLSLGFAALRDGDGKLIGLVACRLSEQVEFPALLRTLPMFIALSALAGLLSFAVALILSGRIARPIKALTVGVRDIAAGDYQARVREEGGRELAELAGGFNAMAANLDRLHQLEAEMRRREQFAALGEAAAAIAHEIRNPLGIIKTSGQVIRMKAPLAEGSDRLIGFILDEVDRIDRLVQDLLDYVRPKEPEREPLDLHRDIVLRVLDFAAPELERRGVTQALGAPEAPLPILGDRRHLYDAVLNIVLNAMDAMPDGGQLTVELRNEAGQAVLQIQDSGAGIPESIRDRVFDPFVTSKPRGTGLGLAKVLAVVEQHGGRIDFRSAEGEGAVFTLSFPLHGEAS